MAATTLPKFFVLQEPYAPSGLYVCPVEASANEPSHVLKCEESQIFSPRVKFATELSETTGDATLVHIRSCYNNKYWVPVYQGGSPEVQQYRIAASADQPEEDQSKPGCTLFRVSSGLQLKSITWPSRYLGVDENRTLVLKSTTTTFSTVVDWEKLVVLPSQVMFKSERFVGAYLTASTFDLYKVNAFGYNPDLDDPEKAYQLFPTHRGDYRIKSLYHGKFWRTADSDPNMIVVDAEDNNNDSDTIFECIKIHDNVIALRSSFNKRFCGESPLCATYQTISKETRLFIEERVVRREISIHEYYLPRSRIYGGQVLALAEQTIQNRSPVADLEQSITFSETIAKTASWNNMVSVNVSVSYEMQITIIPLIAKGKVSLSVSASFDHQWGGSETTSSTIESTTKVVVPPLTNMKVSFLCTKATCDVPFSYKETDLLHGGASVSRVYISCLNHEIGGLVN